jgi:hypothetical protein
MLAHAMLDVESYNVFLKKWAKSRKNLGEGLSRLNASVVEAWLGKLTILDLQPPAAMSKTDIFEYDGVGARKCINSEPFFVHVVALLLRDHPAAVSPVRRCVCVYSPYRCDDVWYRFAS